MAEAAQTDVQVLLDKEAIKEIWYNRYYLVDKGDLDGVIEGFTEDATMDIGASRRKRIGGWITAQFSVDIAGEQQRRIGFR